GYIGQVVLTVGKPKQAVIFRKENGSVWASFEDFSIAPEGLQTIIEGFNDPSIFYANVIIINGERKMCIKVDDK
ncbi:hypothetical protein K502DRAFT_275686, partial [Neoconidiobolus thromboides FSU 785]